MTDPKEIQAALAAARKEDVQLLIDAYCDNGACPGRAFRVYTKDHDEMLLKLVAQRSIRCPICGEPAKVNGAITTREVHEVEDRKARWSVNTQMYIRDHNIHAVPIGVKVDDRLPPTPPDWWQRLPPEAR